MRRIGVGALLALSAAVLLAGCTQPPPVTTEDLAAQLDDLPTATRVQVLGARELTVDISPDATDEAVLADARAAARIARDGRWPGDEILFESDHDGVDPVLDLAPLAAWRQVVFPDEPSAVGDLLAEKLTTARIPAVASFDVVDGWPYVTFASLEDAPGAISVLRALPRFSAGATYSFGADAPRLKMVDIPERITLEGLTAIIRIGRECGACDIELASMTTGPRWPELYVSHLSPAEVAVVDSQLRDPALADVDPDGYSIPFQLSFVGSDGPVYTFGTFGDVPDTSS